MIPGGIGAAVGVFFCIAAFACWTLAIWSATRGIRDIVTQIRTGTPAETDSGTAAVFFAGGFVLFMLFRVAIA